LKYTSLQQSLNDLNGLVGVMVFVGVTLGVGQFGDAEVPLKQSTQSVYSLLIETKLKYVLGLTGIILTQPVNSLVII
jgi:hypothetical protein